MTKETGGQAFPIQSTQHDLGENGMTLRDYYAGQALIGMTKSNSEFEGVIENEQSKHLDTLMP